MSIKVAIIGEISFDILALKMQNIEKIMKINKGMLYKTAKFLNENDNEI